MHTGVVRFSFILSLRRALLCKQQKPPPLALSHTGGLAAASVVFLALFSDPRGLVGKMPKCDAVGCCIQQIVNKTYRIVALLAFFYNLSANRNKFQYVFSKNL